MYQDETERNMMQQDVQNCYKKVKLAVMDLNVIQSCLFTFSIPLPYTRGQKYPSHKANVVLLKFNSNIIFSLFFESFTNIKY